MSHSKFISDGTDFIIQPYDPDYGKDGRRLSEVPPLPEQNWLKFLNEEIAAYPEFKEEWTDADNRNKNCIGLLREEEIAITTYTGTFHETFNPDTRDFYDKCLAEKSNGQRKQLFDAFHWKGMGYYLYHGLRRMGNIAPTCEHAYRGIPKKFSTDIRVGHVYIPKQFMSCTRSEKIAHQFGEVVLDIETYCGASIDMLSLLPEEEEVLVPPSERFYVESQPDENMYRLLSLNKMMHNNQLDDVVEWCNIS